MRRRALSILALLSLASLWSGCATSRPSSGQSLNPQANLDPPRMQHVRKTLDSALWLQARGRFVQAQGLLSTALSELSVVDTTGAGEAVSNLTVQVLASMRNSLPYSLEPDALEDAVLEEADGVAVLDSIVDSASGGALDSTTLAALRSEVMVDTMATFDLPIEVNDQVLRNIRLLKDQIPQHFARWLERKGRWEDMINQELTANGMPRDLIFQAMIESGFNPRATSPAAAAGIWQFIPGTGRRFGMRIDRFVDERRDPVKSTRAAIAYLSILYQQFGDWKLAMAAYNCGEYCVERTIRKAGHNDYWTLPLPRETKQYVPRIFAAAILGKNPKAHGFELQPWAPVEMDTFTVEGGLTFAQIGKALSIPEDSLSSMNPALVRQTTPPARESWVLNIPQGLRERFALAYPDLEKSYQAPAPQRTVHKVRRKETLVGIASRYGVSVADLKRWNKISGKRVWPGRALIVYGDYPGAPLTQAKEPPLAKRGEGIPARSKQAVHKVRRGETLASIALRYGVSRDNLAQWNGESAEKLKAGKLLWVSAPGEGISGVAVVARNPVAAATTEPTGKPEVAQVKPVATPIGTRHRVRRGETLERIASEYGTTPALLRQWNNLKNDQVRSGTRIIVAGESAKSVKPQEHAKAAMATAPVKLEQPTPRRLTLAKVEQASTGPVHVVRDGETLDAIAQRHGVSVGSIKLLNHLRSARIDIGQKLVLPAGVALQQPVAPTPPQRAAKPSAAVRTVSYTVRPGDSLYSIARSRSTTVDTLMQLNGLTQSSLKPGQVIQVPQVASL
ncbi:MAG: LysM peptidoglycan-binding domain-containing protein [Fibrobacterota bacterium]|nr:LysM peptidoglycan-binding domain-containing protein [Fibrobacterota bacterium]QQS05120.1 MAG: LysM peptidoglycan-binding domain-containing protein [Fibrobacterota bacterium]